MPLAPSPAPLRVRKRAKTRTLLGDEYQEVVTEVLKPPMPPLNTSGYNEKHLREGLKYADSTLHNTLRKLSPIGTRALSLYKEACARLLDLEEGEVYDEEEEVVQSVKEEWIATVRMHEQSIRFIACLRVTRTLDAQMLQDKLLSLQRTAFYARYGDILAEACRKLKSEAEARKVQGWQSLRREYWTDIEATLQVEKGTYQKVLQGEDLHDEIPTHIAISQACNRVGFNMRDMLSIIHHYAARNELLHANLIPLIKKGHYSDLKKRLHDDYCDVPLVIPAAEGFQSDLLLTLLESMIELWFNRDPEDLNNHQMWEASEELKRHHKELQGQNPRNEADLQKEISNSINKEMRKRRREAEKEKELLDALQGDFGLNLGGKEPKRVASSQLQAENERAKKMRKDWAKIGNMVHGLRSMSDTYFLMYGELGAPAEVVSDPSLDD
ncbi:MAG: hypothetical protein M1839_001650 [Geoglossum umbratile]|nr:MAG: hypothetical protein M1839_001650 [Geoglossum umbratile]